MKRWSVFVACFFFLFLLPGCAQEPQKIEVTYIHQNPCESCREFDTFVQWFQDEAVPEGLEEEIEYREINLFQSGAETRFEQICREIGVDPTEQSFPMLVIGTEYLCGEEAIHAQAGQMLRQNLEGRESGGTASGQGNPGHAAPTAPALRDTAINPEDSVLLFFVTSACSDCAAAKEHLYSLPESWTIQQNGETVCSTLQILEQNVSTAEGFRLAQDCFAAYHVPQEEQAVPIVFYSGGYLAGAEAIRTQAEAVLQAGEALDFSFPDHVETEALSPASLPGFFLAGLLGGVNPCSISMLLLLMSLLTVRRERTLLLGGTYLLSKLLTGLCIGLFFYSALQLLESSAFGVVQIVLRCFFAVLAFALAAGYFLDAWNARQQRYQKIRMQLPKRLRQWTQNRIAGVQKVSAALLVPAVFLVGVLVSAGEFLCTGQIYLASILYLMQTGGGLDGLKLAAFLCYLLGSIIPAAVLVVLIYRGRRVLGISEAIRKSLSAIKAATGLFFLLFGVFSLFFG